MRAVFTRFPPTFRRSSRPARTLTTFRLSSVPARALATLRLSSRTLATMPLHAPAPSTAPLGGPAPLPPRELYPQLAPHAEGFLPEEDGHAVYYEVSGNPAGKPALFLHGGPGGGTSPKQRGFFDPAHYRIILFDQRGSGKSTPFASLVENTTQKLVSDIERLRVHLGVDTWLVFGGSWGSTLALAYAQAHAARVTSLVLRGIFALRRSELLFFYQEGASHLFPDAWDGFLAPIPEAERGDLMAAYRQRLTSADIATRDAAAQAWSIWEGVTSKLHPDDDMAAHYGDPAFALAFARIENHYFVNAGFMREGQLLERANVDLIRHIPTVIVQGRYDLVCPMATAWALHKQWPEADFRVVPDAGQCVAWRAPARELSAARRSLPAPSLAAPPLSRATSASCSTRRTPSARCEGAGSTNFFPFTRARRAARPRPPCAAPSRGTRRAPSRRRASWPSRGPRLRAARARARAAPSRAWARSAPS